MKTLRKTVEEEDEIPLCDFSIADDSHLYAQLFPLECYVKKEEALKVLETADKSGMGKDVEKLYKELVEGYNTNTKRNIERDPKSPPDYIQGGKNPKINKLRYGGRNHMTTFTFAEYISMGRPRYLAVKRKIMDEFKKAEK